MLWPELDLPSFIHLCLTLCNEQYHTLQEELVEFAQNRNVIIYLDTGSGKTYIAALIIQRKLSQLKAQNKSVRPHLALSRFPVHRYVMMQCYDLYIAFTRRLSPGEVFQAILPFGCSCQDCIAG